MAKPMKPQVVAWELGKWLDDDAIISCDSGTIATWFARQLPVKRRQKHSLSGTLATKANGLPYTIAAQVAYPERQCIGFVGDGRPQVHAHAIVGRRNGAASGGHLMEARVRPTCELILTESPEHLQKQLDPDSGLALIRV